MKTTTFPTTVNELLNHPQWDGFISDKLGNDLFINDPERAGRIHEAAEHGCDGSTHAEHIEDWREFAEVLYREERRRINQAETDEQADAIEAEIEAARDTLLADIDRAEQWHADHGTLDQQAA